MQRQKRAYLQFAQTDDTRLDFSAFWQCGTKEELTFILPTQLARCTLWHCQGRAYLQNAYKDEKRLDLAPSGMTASRRSLYSASLHRKLDFSLLWHGGVEEELTFSLPTQMT